MGTENDIKNNKTQDKNKRNIENGTVEHERRKDREVAGEGNKNSFVKDVVTNEIVDLESVLRELKISGRYHLKFMLLIGILALVSMLHSVHYVFSVENVGYRCKYSHCTSLELSKLLLNSSLDHKCHKYKLINDKGSCDDGNFDVSSGEECDEWIYDKPDSFVAEFNIGCEEWKRTLVGTMHSVGYMLGLLLVGPVSDKFGRKKMIIFSTIASSIIGLSKSVVYSYWLFVALETIEPLLGDWYSATFTLAVESVTKEHRPIIICLLSIFTTFGGIILALTAWLAPNWRIFLVAIYAPGFLFILYIFWMDESLRWLLNKGKKDEVDDIIRQAAKTNNIVINENKLSKLVYEEDSANVDLATLLKMTFSSKKLFLRLLYCIIMWFTALFNAYSLLINSVSLKGDKYLNYGLTILTGIPASLVILFLLIKCKRKKPLIFSFLLTGAFCTSHAMVPEDYVWISVLLYITGKLCSEISIRIVYIYTSELFPTYTRNTMHALCSATARVAAILAPQTPLLLEYWVGLPSLIMGILSLLTACVVTLLPDTSDAVLPDNVCQAEAVGKKHKEVNMTSRL